MSDHVTILIINDDPVALRLTQRTLDESGYETHGFTSAAEAVSALGGGLRPDLIVSDLHMPGIDGWKLCRLLRGPDFPAFNDTPILVVSATFTGVDVESITADLGANAFLPAPYHPDTLKTYVWELLQGVHPQRALHVLVVDDDEELAATLVRYFESHGYKVDCASDGRRAMEMAESTRYDVYVLDYHLPDTDAAALMAELRRPEEAGVVLIMTGDDDPDLPVRLLDSGAEGYLRKPFDPRYLVDVTQKARRERSLLRVEALLERRTNELRESDGRMRALFRAIPDWVVVVNWQGVIVQANEAAFRAASEDTLLIGRPLKDFLETTDGVSPQDKLAAAWSTGRGHFEAKLKVHDGMRFVELAAEVTELEGDPVLLMVARDITARQEAEQARRALDARMQHAQRMESLGVMAGGIAHDFNNLLVGILGNASLGLMEVTDGPGLDALRQIEMAARRAADLTNQILTFAGRSQTQEEELELGTLMEELLEMARPSISRKAQVHVEVDDDLPVLHGDPSQLQQALLNLIVNASEALDPEEGEIWIGAHSRKLTGEVDFAGFMGEALHPGRHVEFVVRDSGSGMNPETLGRIFEPFFTTKFTGRGLGLSATLGIVQAHDGAVRVESEPGVGTTVRLLLPVERADPRRAGSSPRAGLPEVRETTPSAAEVPVTGAFAGGKVLVADDEPAVLRLATAVLKRAGLQVYPARDGQEALDVFQEAPESWALVIADLTMPGLDGVELLDAVRGQGSRVPYLLSSGYDRKRVMEMTAEHSEPLGFLSKPYRPAELVQEVRALVPGLPEASATRA